MSSKVWDEITNPFPKFNGSTVEVWEWICYLCDTNKQTNKPKYFLPEMDNDILGKKTRIITYRKYKDYVYGRC